MACPICVSNFNKTTRCEVTCSQCNLSACRTCQKTYILGSVNEPHCMGCKIPWNSDFITANFTKKFFNEDLAAHRANAIFESEKALMPASQERIRIMNLQQEIITLNDLVRMYEKMKKTSDAKFFREKVQQILRENPELEQGRQGQAEEQRKVVYRPVCGCIREDCRGFIMNNNWKCGMCDTKVCSDCLKEDTGKGQHVCLDADKKTRTLLLKDTKPCPKCAAMIHKTEGCSQMWCVMCHTTFDWNTNEIVTGYVHNPHYFEWARRNGREIARAPGDVPPGAEVCGDELPDIAAFTRMLRTYEDNDADYARRLYQLTAHIRDITHAELRDRNTAEARDTLRMKYLTDELSEKDYKQALIKTERRAEKVRAEWAAAELFMMQASDLLRNIYNTRPPRITNLPAVKEMNQLVIYCNDNFKRIAKAYSAAAWYKINLNRGIITKER